MIGPCGDTQLQSTNKWKVDQFLTPRLLFRIPSPAGCIMLYRAASRDRSSIMAEKTTLEPLFFQSTATTAKSTALSPLLANCNQYFHNIAALSVARASCECASCAPRRSFLSSMASIHRRSNENKNVANLFKRSAPPQDALSSFRSLNERKFSFRYHTKLSGKTLSAGIIVSGSGQGYTVVSFKYFYRQLPLLFAFPSLIF